MGLRTKFNLVLLVVFSLGLAITGYISYTLLQQNAQDEVLRNAGIIMEATQSMRDYTQNHVSPSLDYQPDTFLAQSVPAFAATEMMNGLRKKYADYNYKEAVLNPTNLRDRAVEWETDIVTAFRNDTAKTELSGMRMSAAGQSLYLSRPIRVTEEGCLTCHSTADKAPPAMTAKYGNNNGFGWKLNEIIGAQVVSVPMALPVKNADRAFATFMASLSGVFVVLFVILNLMLSFLIVRPITDMSEAANEISTGNMDIAEFADKGSDEMALLAKSFNRMRRSLQKAISLIDE
jgi:HAMP domain-containing protein